MCWQEPVPSPQLAARTSAAQVGTERPRAYNVTQLDEAIHASNHFVQCLLNLGMGTSQKLDPGAFFSYPASAPSATSCLRTDLARLVSHPFGSNSPARRHQCGPSAREYRAARDDRCRGSAGSTTRWSPSGSRPSIVHAEVRVPVDQASRGCRLLDTGQGISSTHGRSPRTPPASAVPCGNLPVRYLLRRRAAGMRAARDRCNHTFRE